MDLIRSWMFVPGHRQKMIDKALGLNTDAIMLDIEDGVAPSEKDYRAPEYRRVLGPRQSRRAPRPALCASTPSAIARMDADLDAVVRPGLEGLVCPKLTRQTK